jgi:hypothetical protein
VAIPKSVFSLQSLKPPQTARVHITRYRLRFLQGRSVGHGM